MAGLKLNHIYKVYPNGVKAVNDFTMEIKDKEFIVFVGPSGCGKSTTLRMIAGLEEITAGELSMDGVVMNDMESKDRDLAMVFQNYALYPHMTVYENMAFGLKLRKVPKDVIDKKIKEAAEILGITEYLNRKPAAMSGGQRQRVALGRAIVREPKAFLLDEPLSNLDAKLRTQMRSEISKLHHKLQTTFIYVTHDQVEAMTMGTRIVVMKDGFIQQADTPRNLYRFPENKFVAGFIGTPQMNFFNGKMKSEGDKINISFDNTEVSLNAPAALFNKADRKYFDGEQPVIFGIRAEHVSVNPEQYAYRAKCRVSQVEELGTECLVFADFNIESEDTVTESPTRVIIKALAGTEYEFGEVIEVSLDLNYLRAFDAQTEITILPRIPKAVKVDGEVSGGELVMLGHKTALPAAMNIPDGKYEITVPADSIALSGGIRVDKAEEEDVNGQKLLHLHVGGRVLFAVSDGTAPVTGISVDLKQLTFTGANGYTFAAIPRENELAGKLSKHKEVNLVEINGKTKKVKSTVYTLGAENYSFICPEEKAARIISGGGSAVFNKELTLAFSPYAVKVAEEGIDAQVEEVLDYGDGKFAKCKIGEASVFVSVENNPPLGGVKLAVDADGVTVTENERNILLA